MEHPKEKASDVSMTIVDTLNQRCQCKFTPDLISSEGFQCFPESENAVTFRAELSEAPVTPVSVLVSHLTDWVSSGTAISIGALFITVDSACSIVIPSFISEECQIDITTALATSYSEQVTVNITGVAVTLVFVVATVPVVVIVVVLIIRKKRAKSNQPQSRVW